VRDPKGTGSGWAGTDDFDVTRIDMNMFARIALEKCQRSMNPSALEPGRYVTILEPQAVADLVAPLVPGAMGRGDSEDPLKEMPFYRSPGRSKIGEHVLDSRLSLTSDPMDPIGGFRPFDGEYVYNRAEWIKEGVLMDLAYWIYYALGNLGIEKEMNSPNSWRLSGGTTSTDEMIATTKRGVLVTRLHNVQMVHQKSMTCTGYTRDGLWLIENGKISRPVKNFRFTESPLFVLNKVEQLGEPKRVFSGTDFISIVAPTLKVQDFNFTQLSDAV
jgi:predicted Zn-dependent protease